MKVIKYDDYTIEIFTSAKEWGVNFYDMPEDAVIDEEFLKELNGEINGFACLETKTISLLILNKIDEDELEETIAHEVGHIVEGGFKKNPPDKPRYDKKHELKAKHYEEFYVTVRAIIKLVLEKLKEDAKI